MQNRFPVSPHPAAAEAGAEAVGSIPPSPSQTAGSADPLVPWPDNLSRALARRQLPGLDALRAFSVLLVVFYHHDYPMPGSLGVLSFFVLSGFLITWLLLHEHRKHGAISLRRFYVRRALRLFPAFYLYWLVATGLLLATGKFILWPQAWSAFFYVNNYYQAVAGHFGSVYSHTWSLAVEEQFYLLWPVALIALLRRRANLPAVLMAAIGVAWVWRAVLMFGYGVHGAWIYEAFDARADHLLMGCLLAVALERKLFGRFWAAVCSHRLLPAVTVGLLALEVAAGHAMGGTDHFADFILQPLLVAILLVQIMAFASTPGWRWLNWAPLAYIGKISYSIYLHQQFTPSLVKPLIAGFPGPVILITLPAIVATASASYYLVERRFLILKEKYGERPPPEGLAALARAVDK